MELRLQAAPSWRAVKPQSGSLLARRDRERSRACDAAKVEVRSCGPCSLLLEAGLTLIAETQEFAKGDFERAKGIRNGLMIALLALCPVRVKNYAALEIGSTFKQVNDSWWIAVPQFNTKTK